MGEATILKVGEIEVEEGMIEDIASEWRGDAESLEQDIKRGYGYDGGEEQRIDDEADLCKLQITSAVMDDYLELVSRLADAERERDRLRVERDMLADVAVAWAHDIKGDLRGIEYRQPTVVDKYNIGRLEQIYIALPPEFIDPPASPVTITRIAHPESDARPVDAESRP